MKNPVQPPVYFMSILILTIIFHFIFPIKKIVSAPYNYLGIALILFGIIINLWTDNQFKKAKTNVKYHKIPDRLITSGTFKISRNPMYLGMLCIILGTSFILGSIISFLFPIIFIIIIETKFIPIEEKNMQNKFGKEFVVYKKNVRRWI